LAQAYSLEAANFQEHGARNLALAEQAARKAIALNHIVRGERGPGSGLWRAGQDRRFPADAAGGRGSGPNSVLAWKQLGYIYHYAGLIDQAEAAFAAAVTWIHPATVLLDAWSNAVVSREAHDAEVEVRQALARYPDQFKLLAFLVIFSTIREN